MTSSKKLPPGQGAIQHLSEAHFHLPDAEPIIVAGAAVLFLQRHRQALQPLAEKALHLLWA
jgi:hypothetical protein